MSRAAAFMSVCVCVCVCACVNMEGGSSHADRWRQGNCVSPCLVSSLMSYCTQRLISGWMGGTAGIREVAGYHLNITVCLEKTGLSLLLFMWPLSSDLAIFWAQRELFLCVHISACFSSIAIHMYGQRATQSDFCLMLIFDFSSQCM